MPSPGGIFSPMVWPRISPVVGVVVAGYVLIVVAFLSRHGWDVANLAHTSQQAEESRVLQRYDGGAYYTIATDPFPLRQTPDIDSVRLRYSRPLYPLLAGALALGKREWVPYTLLGINLLAVGLGTGLLAKALYEGGYSPWWAVSYGLHPGIAFSVLLDLSEPLLYALVLLAMDAVKRERWGMGAVFFSLALFAKEEAGIFLAGVGLYLIWVGQQKRAGVMAMAFLPWGGLVALLHLLVREETTALGFPGSPFGFLMLPFLGYYEAVRVGFNTDMALTFGVTFALILVAVLASVRTLMAGLVLSKAEGLVLILPGKDEGSATPYPFILLLSAIFLSVLHFSTAMWPSSLLRFHLPLALGLMFLGIHHNMGRLVRYSPLWAALTAIYLGHFLR